MGILPQPSGALSRDCGLRKRPIQRTRLSRILNTRKIKVQNVASLTAKPKKHSITHGYAAAATTPPLLRHAPSRPSRAHLR
jgi:hypothetical protein